jgi:redox-sensitive bicupin YhaK (pirin superfamily)
MNTTATSFARVARKLRGMPASDGAGVKLTRVIGTQQLDMLDPFLMLDEFGTDRAEDYLAGFPDHPHRGFETVTYMLDGRMRGFQLWVNLPAQNKMDAPQYQEFAPDRIPVVEPGEGVQVKVIAGEVDGTRGPIVQPATSPVYLDIALAAGAQWEHRLPDGHNAFAYVFEGDTTIGMGDDARPVAAQELAVLGGGESFAVRAGTNGARLILVAGRPLREPVARYGPFVMNTKEQIMQAFVDFQEGKF